MNKLDPQDTQLEQVEYIGDGIYAAWDGHMIELRSNHHEFPTSRIYLEPETIDALQRMLNRIRKQK